MNHQSLFLRLSIALILMTVLLSSFTSRPVDMVTGPPLQESSLITPFVHEANITAVNEAYSTTANCPWGFVHMGIDFFAVNGSPFQAVADATLIRKEKYFNPGNNLWQVNVELEYNATVSFTYNFEPDAVQESGADQQFAMIPHTVGTHLTQGEGIGDLLAFDEYAHVHWDIQIGSEDVCPEPFFTPAARQSVLNVIHQTNATWDMCYCGTDPCPTGNSEVSGFTYMLLIGTFSVLFILRKNPRINKSKCYQRQK